MAKRKRLTPPQAGYLDAAPGTAPAMRALLQPAPIAPPIAQVAGEASAQAALGEVAEAMASARAEGRLVETLPLAAIDPGHLVRDRMMQDAEEMEALVTSLEARGQQTPIEVVALPAPKNGFTHGLISGWRRLSALQQLERKHGDRFGRVKALVVAPPDRQAAYVAMVEENEIRANLSLYERARIVQRAWGEEVYPTRKLALQGLFGSVSRSKRSKINSFIGLVEALDSVLRFPTAISEKLGLELARALADVPEFRTRAHAALRAANARNAEEEIACLAALLEQTERRPALPPMKAAAPEEPPAPLPSPPQPRVTTMDETGIAARLAGAVTVRFDAAAGRIELSGRGVDANLHRALQDWLKRRRS